MTASFSLDDNHRFGRILLLVFLFHLFLLLRLDIASPDNPLKSKLLPFLKTNANSSHSEVKSETLSMTFGSKESAAIEASFFNTASNPGPLKTDLSLPKKRTISAANHDKRDAPYLQRWQDYLEQFGNDHYPSIALQNNLQGNLRLLVAIKKDGTLKEVSIRQSSGSPILDKAAIDIVKKAAPFEPLPPEVGQNVEVLEIIRTWQFHGKSSKTG